MIGRTLSHFQILSKLGQGGMGEVYRAFDTKLRREIAIKTLPQAWVSDAERRNRFEREAQVIAALNHPNIVTIYSIEEAGDLTFIAMELVRGEPLTNLIPASGLSLKRFFELAIPITDALSAVHERGIAHHDLKPSNILVNEQGRVKVLDFGLARLPTSKVPAERSELPTEPLVAEELTWGTLPYMSPEQLQGKTTDYRSDIFSLGIILYEMSTGKRPFSGRTSADLIAAILRDNPLPVSDLNLGIPRDVGRIIQQCLEKDIEHRPQVSLDLNSKLKALQSDLGSVRVDTAPSIAVIPFTDMSPGKDQGHFCEGVAEEIIIALSKLKGLHVIPRASSFQYKSTALDSLEIGRRLGVATLLEGSVRKSDDRLRVAVELIDVTEGFNLWSGTLDREMKDVFAIQEEIARSVAASLKVTLSPVERRAIKTTPTNDLQAYDYYLRGRQFFYQYRAKSVEFALRMFSRAIQLDPAYARAYAGLADCCSFLYWYAGGRESHREQADNFSLRALDLEPEAAEAHVSRGVALSLSGRYNEAARAFENAIFLNPRLFEAYYFYARLRFAEGKSEEAIELYEKASEARPDDYQVPLLVAQVYSDLGRKEEAEASRRKGVGNADARLKLQPDDVRALYMGGNGLVALGEVQVGLEWADQALEIDPLDSMVLYNVACVRCLAGRFEDAMNTLESAVKGGLMQRDWLEHDSNLDALRQFPRFRVLTELLKTQQPSLAGDIRE